MRLKNPSAVAAFQSQLSAILDKLLVLAAEEIKELVFDYCEELSREKTQNSALCERTREDQDEDIIYDTSNSFIIEPQGGHNETEEHMTQTDRREEAGNKLSVLKSFSLSAQDPLSVNCKFGQVSTVSENAPTNSQQEDCSQDGSEQSSLEPQFCCDPPEDDKDHLIDYNSPVDTECTPYQDISTNPDRSPDVEFHIKQEEESPGFETGRNIDVIKYDVEQGLSFDTYTRSEDTLGPSPLDIPGPMLDIPSFSLPDQHMNAYISNQENQFGGHSEPLPVNKQDKKYVCDFCNKKFCYPSDLKHHRLWHTRERTHVCGMCGKAFITRSHLRRHELMHLDVQPSVCHICGYKTSRLVYLKVHMKMHSKKQNV